MKILMVSQMTPYLPCHDGFRVIPANLIRELSKRHQIRLLAFSDGTENRNQLEWARGHCVSVEIYRHERPLGLVRRLTSHLYRLPPEVVKTVRSRILAIKPDVLHLEGPSLAPLARLADSGIFTLLSAHDSLSLRNKEFAKFANSFRERSFYRLRAITSGRLEKDYKWCDRVTVTSTLDFKALIRNVNHKRISVISNGIDLDHWAYQPAPESGRIVFTGNMSWPPNEDAAEHFAVEVLPLIRQKIPEAEFWVVGADPSGKVQSLSNCPGVNVTGTVPDVRKWIWKASVYVSPLRFGAGVKNKILEAMALGTPIVATPKSLTGTPLVHNCHLLIAEGARDMAEAVLKILTASGVGQSLSKAARKTVELEYSWESIGLQFEQLYYQ